MFKTINRAKDLAPAKSGAIAPIAALTLVAILLVSVLAIDTSRLIGANMKAKMVADTAAMNAVSMVRDQIDEGLRNALDNVEIEKIAYDTFMEQIILHNLDVKNLDIDFKVEGDDYIVDVNYEVELPKMLTDEAILIKDSTTAVTNYTEASTYMDIHLLVDLSASMSTGATIEDQAKLWKTDGCAFACHASNVRKARDNNIALRQDKLAAALRSLGNVAEAALDEFDLEDDSTQFNIWKFRNYVRAGGVTTNISTFKTYADRVNNEIPSGHTNIAQALDWLRRYRLPESGDGFSPETRKTFVFLITDGMSSQGNRLHISGGRGTVNPAYCKQIKDKGATMAVIYTKYDNYAESYKEAWGTGRSNVGRWGRWNYNTWVNHYNRYTRLPLANMSTEMRNCASDEFYFETNSPAELNTALEKLYENAILKTKGEPRLAS